MAMRSVASLAALTARVLGIISRAFANSAMASCSLESSVVAKDSRKQKRAASTAPPPIGLVHSVSSHNPVTTRILVE